MNVPYDGVERTDNELLSQKVYRDANILESESNASERRLTGTSTSKHSMPYSKKSAQGTKSNQANLPDAIARKDRVRALDPIHYFIHLN